MSEFFSKSASFVKEVSAETRIPTRDKQLALALIFLIVSPFDLIPDWVPLFGMLDDIVMIALVLDYFFFTLDEDVLLSHYPFGMKSFVRIRAFARTIGLLAPRALKRRIWKYQSSPYRK